MVVDTNVWVSGLILPDSVPGAVVEAIRGGRVDAVASWELAAEIVDVLRRPRLRRYEITEQDVQDILVLLAPLLPDIDVRVQLRDPDDAPVVAAALAAGAAMIVTGDDDLLGHAALRSWLRSRGVEVLSPRDALE